MNSTRVKAVSFTLPSGSDYSLDNVILRLSQYDTAGEEPIVQIRNDVGGSDPGSTILATFNTPAPQGTGAFSYTFTPNSSFTFLTDTKYWLYVTGNGFDLPETTNWNVSSPSITPTGIATFDAYRFSGNGGTSFGDSSTFNSFEINVTEVTATTPEPATLLGLMVFGGGLLVSKRKKEG